MKYIYLALAIALLACLCDMPYGYFQLVRFVCAAVFGWFAYQYYKNKQEIPMYTFGALCLLFQPFVKIALGRTIWNIVDIVVALFLIVLFAREVKKPK